MKTRKNIHKFLHTIRAQIVISTIALIFLVAATITFISYRYVSNQIRTNMIQSSETSLTMMCSSIDSNMNSIASFINSCQNSSKIRSFAMDPAPVDNVVRSEAKEFVQDAYYSNASLATQLVRIVVMSNNSDQILQMVESSNSTGSVRPDTIYQLPYYDAMKKDTGNIVTGIVNDPFIKTRRIPILPILDNIPHPYAAGNIGYIYTEISTSVITNPMEQYASSSPNTLFLQLGENYYCYDNTTVDFTPYRDDTVTVEDLSNKAFHQNTQITRAKRDSDGKYVLLIRRPLSIANGSVTECIDEAIINEIVRKQLSLIVLVVLLSASIIGMLFSSFLNHTISLPIKHLKKRMERIAEGDFTRDPSIEWKHELGDLGRDINDLSENVLLLMNQKLEDEREKKDYEYRMLQSQINPHFLYNTLNSIKWMATVQNSPGIAEITTSLSRLLRDISKGTTNLISLEHELDLVKDYFTIQKYRYGGNITMDIRIDDDMLLDCQILKFTLQPIVENAIFHGIEPKQSAGTITIHIYSPNENDVMITVTDNGVGMDAQTAAHLLDEDSTTSSSFFKQIGVCNVHKRLQYEFGEEYGLSVDSKLGEYTTMSVHLPINTNDEGGELS